MKADELKRKAVEVRRGALGLVHASKGHVGGTMSSADILTAIYYRYLRFDPKHPDDPNRDRFILSKGHTSEGYLWTLADCGYFDKSELQKFNKFGSDLLAHPSNRIAGVELSTGSLGHGLSLAAGIALGSKLSKRSFDSYVLMGDGETDEGSVWEAAMFAAANKLDNLYAVVDRNGMQITGLTENVMPLEPYADKWRSFGFDVAEIDGNDMEQIVKAFDELHRHTGAPKLIISKTVKGKGVSFMENNYKWHHGSLTDEQYQTAMNDLDRELEDLDR